MNRAGLRKLYAHCTNNHRLLAGPPLHILVLVTVVQRAFELIDALELRNVLASITDTHHDVLRMQSDHLDHRT